MLKRVFSRVIKSDSILAAATVILLAGGFSTAAVASCGDKFSGNRTYYFSGKLQVQGEGGTNPLEGAQIRIVRKHSPVKWANVGAHGSTDENGEFNIKCEFARDRNGAMPRGKKIVFKIQARFRNDDLKIRKGGWFKSNWHTIATRRGCKRSEKKRPWKNIPACKEFSFPDLNKTFDTSERVGKHAYLFWFYTHLQQEMAKRNVGLYDRPFFTHRIGVTYPDKSA